MLIYLSLLGIIFFSTFWSYNRLKREINEVHQVSDMNLSQVKEQVITEISKLSKNMETVKTIISKQYDNKNETNM
jgi:peroxiredoxin family protein